MVERRFPADAFGFDILKLENGICGFLKIP